MPQTVSLRCEEKLVENCELQAQTSCVMEDTHGRGRDIGEVHHVQQLQYDMANRH